MIRSTNMFWGGVLIVIGGLFLINSLGILSINLWQVIWPLLLILAGVWMLMGYFMRDRLAPMESEAAALPLENASQAKITFNHGAGKLYLTSGADPMDLLTGTFGGGLDSSVRSLDDGLDVSLRVRDRGPYVFVPWVWGPHNQIGWEVRLTDEIPLDLAIKTGASDTRLDLTDLQVTNLRVETGASATEILLPDSVAATKVVVKAGAASVKVSVPDEVAAKIRVTGGMMSAGVNRDRFPKSGGYYQSPDYDTAAHKVEIRVDMGAGSVTVN
jgi:hypothetical protein